MARAEVDFDQGLVYVGHDGPREINVDEELELTFRFRAAGALDRDYQLFVHLEEAESDAGDEPCRVVRDVPLFQDGREPTQWRRGEVVSRVGLGRLVSCGAGAYDLHLGLWDRGSGDRLAVLGGVAHFDRIHVGPIRALAAGIDTDGTIVELQEPALERPPTAAPALPGVVIVLLLFLVAALGFAVFAWKKGWNLAEAETEAETDGRRPVGLLDRYYPAVAPVVVLCVGIYACLGFVKDDAYISFRYAHNLVTGQGLVFNAGDRVEGYTNFLWTMLLVPFDWLGADLIQVCDVLGPLLSVLLVVLVLRVSRDLDGHGPVISHVWAAMWLASSSSFVLWSVGGLEQSLAALLPLLGAWLTWRGWVTRSSRRTALGALALAGACLTRPEGHLFVVIIGLVWLVVLGVRRRRLKEGKALGLFLAWAAPLSLVLTPYHLWRYLYFGSLLPNTYLVKAVSGGEVYGAGVGLLADLLRFNAMGVLVALAGLSLLISSHRLWRWLSLGLALLFMLYIVKVGTDELLWHRLFLPALPFVALGAGAALRHAAAAAARRMTPSLAGVPYLVGWAVVMLGCYVNIDFTFRETEGLAGYSGCSGMHHPDLGKFLTRHSRPGELVAFQDMGATPFHAPDLRFLDLVGLVDRPVAQLLQNHGVHPFVGATRAARGGEHCARFRDEVLGRRPEWVVLVPWPGPDEVEQVSERFGREDTEELLAGFGAFANTQFDCHLYHDPRFRQRYGHVRTWQRSPVYYLSAFRRRDLLEREPPEVVLQRAPDDIAGPRATFGNGVELLGGIVEGETVAERHEVFVTTWWRVPGPLSEDLTLFVHLSGLDPPESRAALDHPPGDWMYPAPRWRSGQIIEDRVLVQLPVSLEPGEYEVHVGLFDRRTGERVAITSGDATDDERLPVGELRVRPQRHFLDALVPRTDPVEQRRNQR